MRLRREEREGSAGGGAMGEKEFLTVKEAAECLRISPKTIYRMVKQGRLRFYSARRHLYFKRKDVSTLLRK